MKRILSKLILLVLLLSAQNSFAGGPGLFFKVTSHNSILNIKTTKQNHTYPAAGIKIETDGFDLAKVGKQCKLNKNGYCLFSVSDTQEKSLTINGNGKMNITLCLNDKTPVTCQHYNNIPIHPAPPPPPVDTKLSIAVGQSLEGTQPPIIAQTLNGGSAWEMAPGFKVENGVFFSASCTGTCSSSLCIAGGRETTPTIHKSLLAQTRDGGKIWNIIPLNTAIGEFAGTSCASTGSEKMCVAVGFNTIAQTRDNGKIWEVVPPLLTRSMFFGTSCNGAGSNAICTAVGRNDTSAVPGLTLIAQTRDGGKVWSVVPQPALDGDFRSTSCTGTGSTTICTAVGVKNIGDFTLPLIAQTLNGGHSWDIVPDVTTATGSLRGTSCTGNGSTAICVAAGIADGLPFIAQSTNGGNTWNAVPSITSNSGIFYSVSCSGTGSTAMCTAAGEDFTNGFPLLAQTTNGGATWSIVPLNISELGRFRSTHCSINGSTTICTAAGSLGDENRVPLVLKPLLVQTTDGGQTWKDVSIKDAPAHGFFESTSTTASLTGSSKKQYGIENVLNNFISK